MHTIFQVIKFSFMVALWIAFLSGIAVLAIVQDSDPNVPDITNGWRTN
jgi:hypothetical protein